MKATSIGIFFIDQCTKCDHIIWHSDMKDIHIADIKYCPYCGHKLNKDNINIKHL